MKKLSLFAALFCTLAFNACDAGAKKEKEKAEAPMTEDQKALHSLGVLMSQNIKSFELSPEEAAFVAKGLQDGLSGKTKPEEVQSLIPKLQELERTRVNAANEKLAAPGKAFLEKAAKEAGATKTDSGMVIKHVQEGKGASPKATDEVEVNYTGRLIDGTEFDASAKHGGPAKFTLDGVIPCWTEGLQTMKVGGKAKLVCPANLAYGPGGSPPTIPPQATLEFDVELLSIAKPK